MGEWKYIFVRMIINWEIYDLPKGCHKPHLSRFCEKRKTQKERYNNLCKTNKRIESSHILQFLHNTS